jgi:cellulose synthase/poly-beta-1,6-N-acetylglucosamine synthase-like glycosyltransferase
MSKKRKIAALIPARNEEMVIGQTIKSLAKIISPEDIYVIDDGSIDQTANIAKNSPNRLIFSASQKKQKGGFRLKTPQVFRLRKNQGKARALRLVLKKYHLVRKYQYLMFIDADTLVDTNYLKKIMAIFKKDQQKKIACVVGRVKSLPQGWLSAYRAWEYEISQTIHKKAQSALGAIIVCPGCATVCRASLFEKIKLPAETITEDMDLTFTIHRQRLGKIVFEPKATVTTQDPKNLKDFLTQISRWYAGFWQCALKHQIPWGGQGLDLEVAILASEGLFNGLISLSLIIFLPALILKKSSLFFMVLGFDLLIFMLPSLVFTAFRQKNSQILKYLPAFYFLRLLSSLIFLKSFFEVILKLDQKISWDQAERYLPTKERRWSNPFPRLTAFR